MPKQIVLLAVEAGGRLFPVARTRSREVAQIVAAVALEDVEAAAKAQASDEILRALITQEGERLRKAFRVLGLAPTDEELRTP